MRHSWFLIELTVLLLTGFLLISLNAATAEIRDEVFVDGADSTWHRDITPSAGLNTNIPPSIFGQFMDATLQYKLLNIPVLLRTQIGEFVLPVASNYANAVNYETLHVIPANLQAQLNNMMAAVETQFASSSYYSSLHYPKSMINDTVKPAISNITVQSNLTSTVLSWYTNEFAQCTTQYGTQSVNYTQTFPNVLYHQNHELTLLNLSQGVTYFVQFTCTDQSDNVAISPEFSFKVVTEQRILLPLIQK